MIKFIKIISKSDDGIAFNMKKTGSNQWLDTFMDYRREGDWNDATDNLANTEFFKVDETGNYDFFVKYYEKTGNSVLDVTIEEAIPFKYQTPPKDNEWVVGVFWDSGNDDIVPHDIVGKTKEDSNTGELEDTELKSVGEFILGDNANGLHLDWNEQLAKIDTQLPNNDFVLKMYSQTKFEPCTTYKFNAKGDDEFRILIRPVNEPDNWMHITPIDHDHHNTWWQEAYNSPESYRFDIPEGNGEDYYVVAYLHQKGGDAHFDLTWNEFKAPFNPNLNYTYMV